MFWSFVHTPMVSAGRIFNSPEFFQPGPQFILDYDYRLIDSTDCDKPRLRLHHQKYIYIDIYRTCDIASLHNLESIGLKTIFYFLYGNKRDHTSVMDLTSLYSDFVMDGREMLFHSAPGYVSSFHDDEGNVYCAVPAFKHSDADLAKDPLSTNRRLVNSDELELFGTMVVAGATSDHIKVLIPDTFSGPTLNASSPVVLQHVVGLTLGPAVDLSSSLPAANLDRALCRNSILPTLRKRQNSYWSEINPILERWQDVHGANCPVCKGLVRVNMSRHLRLSHTTCQCFWRCPVSSCPAWFASELFGKDHLEDIHKFSEGRGYSYYECLRQFGLEWFGRRSFFDQRGTTGQALWMDLALARKAGQELHNDYVITTGAEFASLKSFFRAAVRALVRAFIDYPIPGSRGRDPSFDCSPIRPDFLDTTTSTRRDTPTDQPEGIPVMSLPPPLTFTASTPAVPVVPRPVRSLTPNNASLRFLQMSPGEDVRVHNVLHRGAVAGISIASTDLLLHIRPLPMEQLILHDMATVCSWPHGARGELFAVARRDIAVARRNLARLTHYVDLQDDHLAACDGALDDGIPLMTVEMFSRPTGGVQSVLDVADRPK